jgi:hypothetical protein
VTLADMDAARDLSDLIDLVTPFAILAASELRVPDALAAGPLSVDRLADEVGCQSGHLRRLLRTLSRKGIFEEVESDVFILTGLGGLLRSDHPISLRDANVPWLPNVASLNMLAYSVRTGRSAFEHVHGSTLWEYLAAHPRDGEMFDRQMRSITGFEAESLVQSYEWESVGSVVDVGGGDGTLLKVLLSRYTSLTGTLFDLPQVVAKAVDSDVDNREAGRFSAVAGDFFVDDLPRGREVYVAKRILYGFDNTKVMTLLSGLRRAMDRDARLLVVEPFTRPGDVDDAYFTHRVDLLMMAVPGGRVRSAAELSAMLSDAGFATSRVISSATPILEAQAV